jgi:uncharacterized membrane protein
VSKPPKPLVAEHIRQNIASIAELEHLLERRRGRVDRVSDAVSRFAGSIRFIAAHAVAFGAWVWLNLALPPERRFDPAFSILGVWASVEALFLSAFVLMSQNRQARQADHWAHVHLQLSLLAEQEATKTLQLLQHLCTALGLDRAAGDRELKQLVEKTPVRALAAELGKARPGEQALVKEAAGALAEELLRREHGADHGGPAPRRKSEARTQARVEHPARKARVEQLSAEAGVEASEGEAVFEAILKTVEAPVEHPSAEARVEPEHGRGREARPEPAPEARVEHGSDSRTKTASGVLGMKLPGVAQLPQEG